MKAKEKQLLEYLKKHCPGRENAISGKQMKRGSASMRQSCGSWSITCGWTGRLSAATAPATSTPPTPGR